MLSRIGVILMLSLATVFVLWVTDRSRHGSRSAPRGRRAHHRPLAVLEGPYHLRS
jgi:hypothetical protein